MDQTIPQGGWWSRNWKWFVPVGCLTLLATCGCCIGGGVLFAFQSIKNSRAYQEAVAKAKADPDVQAALGTPIQEGQFPQGGTAFQGGEKLTQARVSLSGPKGEGSLHVRARERGKDLRFEQLDFIGPDNQVVHLPGVEPAAQPPGGNEDVDLDDGEDEEGEDEAPDVTVEASTDRPGASYRDYESNDADASQCALDCATDEKCKAYTFVKAANGKPARCQLKDRATPRAPSACCVSGVKK